MKKLLWTGLLIGASLFSAGYAAIEGSRFMQKADAVEHASYGHIDAKGLKTLIDSNTPFILLDARGDKWHDNNIIPGALLASYEYSDEELERIIPDKSQLIVVYCFSFTCPLSERLVNKLLSLGYENILEYPAGLKEWRDTAHYPVDTIVEN